jgi:hypothetical protein
MGANHQPSLPACASWRKSDRDYANHAVTERSLPRYGVRQPAARRIAPPMPRPRHPTRAPRFAASMPSTVEMT